MDSKGLQDQWVPLDLKGQQELQEQLAFKAPAVRLVFKVLLAHPVQLVQRVNQALMVPKAPLALSVQPGLRDHPGH